jgi:two-component system, sensor histidine kinase
MPIRILNVGPDQARVAARSRSFAEAGFEVSEAATGRAALDLLRHGAPDVLVLDALDDVDVREVCRAARNQHGTTFVKIAVLVSAVPDADYHAACLESGANLVLADPVPPKVLVAQVRALGSWSRRASDALEESEALAERAFQQADAMLAEADRRKDEFIAILSHELRNPLAPIRYALPVLDRQELNEAGTRAVSVIHRQVDHLARLVDDLLDLSRITGGKIELRRERVTLSAVVEAAVEAASPAIAGAHHTLRLHLAEEPVWVHGDPARLSQVLTNLLNNSAKYTPRGGEIALSTARDEGWAIVRVRDNGMGIPAESLPSVFEMFGQLDRPDKAPGGLGIGLALARRLVDLHGGTLIARSDGAGLGAEFEVRLPSIAAGLDDPTEGNLPRPPRARRLRVLVVDDNADLLDMLAVAVEGEGHEVQKALDGSSAVSAAMAFRPDVVVLDLGLPVMSGFDVARALRRDPGLAHVRLVALTGLGQADDRNQTRDAGFDHHLTKPADPLELQRLLAEIAGTAPV